MYFTRRELLSSICALAGTPAGARAARSENSARQAVPTSQSSVEAVSLSDFESLARERIPRMAYEYISGGAADEITLRWNRESFDRIRLRPRILVDVSNLDTRVTLFGQEMPFPILLAPTAYHRLLHPEGELATVKGAGAAGATLVASMLATTTIDEMAKAATRPLWFQTYILKDRGFTRDLVQRAEGLGCKALCVTVDSPVVGVRNRDQRARFALPPEMERANLKGLMRPGGNLRPPEGDIYTPILDASIVWKEIDWLRSFARAPVLLKGVLNPDDADRAVKAGASGIIVSNHGARNLDTVPATIDALPEVADKVAGRIPILMDSGVRRGTDVLKALAMGATATLIGRPYLYGLGVAGSEGVRRVVNILHTEFKIAMALAGRPSLRDLDHSTLWLKQP
ncbi:MAG TPA: alpha-hydroxy acid oxidase [Blastocatellia bacterium]|nr:alpha-hydroxy acid oxidase [Blastocatellia bacterium]